MTALAVWTSRKALQCSASALYWRDQAVKWQAQAGANEPDAIRWRLHLKDCARGGQTAAQRQRLPKLQMMERLRGEG